MTREYGESDARHEVGARHEPIPSLRSPRHGSLTCNRTDLKDLADADGRRDEPLCFVVLTETSQAG